MQEFDVVVIGSGASGGWAAKQFSEAGINVALVEAGRAHRDNEFMEHQPPFELPYGNLTRQLMRKTQPHQADCYACTEFNRHWFADDLEEPYTHPEDKPFSWQGRLRLVGGRTNVWGRQSYRMSEQDLKGYSFDGAGADWPLGYDDLAPYYDRVEGYVGVSGQAEGVAELPDGNFQPAMPLTCAETLVRTKVKEAFGRTITIGRTANLTKPLNGRSACHYCGPCERGCATQSYFNSAFTTVADAMATGKCSLVTNAMVYQVMMDQDQNRATGVRYVDRITRETKEIRARRVVLCAQSLESVRILLNSATTEYSDGLANSSGVLGHYLMDHLWVAGGSTGDFPEIPATPTFGQPVRPNGMYGIRFRNAVGGPRHPDFLRGFGFQGGNRIGLDWGAAGFGEEWMKALLEPVTRVRFAGFGECLPYYENYVELDKNMVDTFGIPVLHINMGWKENELAMVPDMAATASEMLEAAGAKNIEPFEVPDRVPGFGIHEVGVARMGDNPKTSVLNQFQQTHDVHNLFVMDGAGFPSGGCQNPTLTIMALALRSCDYLMAEMQRGNL